MLKYRLCLSTAGGSGHDIPDPVSQIAVPDDLRLCFNVEFHFGYTGYGNRLTVASDPIKGAITIRDEKPRGRSLQLPSAQIPFVADDKLDVFGDEIEPVSKLNQLRTGRASKTRIDFNDDWATSPIGIQCRPGPSQG